MKIDGQNILYHFFAEELENNPDLFKQLIVAAINKLGIWFHPDYYKHYPIMLPYVVRDAKCRPCKENHQTEEWGAPNSNAYLRDDNSLVKSLVKSLQIKSKYKKYSEGKISNGFVASHIWSETELGLASKVANLNTFVPNLVWLPAQISKLTDREGSFTQRYVQRLSIHIYKSQIVKGNLKNTVNNCWDKLTYPKTDDIESIILPDISSISFFEFDERFVKRKIKNIEKVISLLDGNSEKFSPSRYADNIKAVAKDKRDILKEELENYVLALRD